MIERYRDADSVTGCESEYPADESGIVQNVVVAQGRALGCTCRAGGKLNIDRIVRFEAGCDAHQV